MIYAFLKHYLGFLTPTHPCGRKTLITSSFTVVFPFPIPFPYMQEDELLRKQHRSTIPWNAVVTLQNEGEDIRQHNWLSRKG